jgi:hypothetical protein
MKAIKLFLILAFLNSYSQNDKKHILKYEGKIDGVFEVIQIDTLKSVNLIKLRLKYILNRQQLNNVDIPNSYEAFIYSEKVKLKKSNKLEKLKIGSEYFFELKHMFFYKSLYPAPNDIPFALDLEGKRIWEENNDFGIYNTSEIKGISYVIK